MYKTPQFHLRHKQFSIAFWNEDNNLVSLRYAYPIFGSLEVSIIVVGPLLASLNGTFFFGSSFGISFFTSSLAMLFSFVFKIIHIFIYDAGVIHWHTNS